VPEPQRFRIAVAGFGAILMVGSAIFGFYGSGWIAHQWPDAQPAGLKWLAVLFAPLTAIAILFAAILWARRLRASAHESLVALLMVEVVAWGVVVSYAGEFITFFVLTFLAASNAVFAPWWLLGSWVGRRYGPSPR
jgi:hypothetical protein